MGRYNSSITRVKPLGDAIRSNHDILKRMLSIVAPNVPSVFGKTICCSWYKLPRHGK